MSNTDKQKFLVSLRTSKIVSEEVLTSWLGELATCEDAQSTAKRLIELGRITDWQANCLLSGRNRLRFGNYVLLDRHGLDDLGDSFVGKHDKLDRKVNLLLLATEHSEKLKLNEAWIRELASTTDVDHPNLEQVHLIDQDSDRYLFVTQFLQGQKLSDPELLRNLRSDQIPGLISQMTLGLSAAHESGLFHGNLSDDHLFVTAARDLKIEGFLKSNLRMRLIGNLPETGRADIESLKLVVKRLSRRFGSYDISTIEAEINACNDSAALKQFVNRINETKTRQDNLVGLKTKSAVAKPATDPLSSRAIVDDRNHAQRQSNLIRSLLWVSAGLLATSMLFLLGPKLLGVNAPTPLTDADSTFKSDDELPSLKTIRTSPNSKNESNGLTSKATEPVQTEPVQTNERDEDFNTSVSRLERTNLADRSELNLGSNDDFRLSKDSSDGSLKARPEDTKQTPTKSPSSLLDKFKSTSDEADLDIDDEATRKPEKKPKSVSAEGESPASSATSVATSFPDAVDLPPTSVTESSQIVNFGEQPVSAVGLELLSADNVSTKKLRFRLSGERNRSWDVSMKDSRSETKIGQFVWSDNQLRFKWLAAAVEKDDSNFLRNCVLSVNDGSGSKWLPLRKPVVIPGFVLERDKPRLKIEIENLHFLPKGAIAELHKLDRDAYGQVFFGVGVEDQTFSRKKPLQIAFTDVAEYQMVALTLSAELKNKSKLEALLQVRLSPEQKPRLANEKTMSAAKQYLEQYVLEVTQNYETLRKTKIDDLRKQLNMTKEELTFDAKKARVKQLKEEIEISKKRAEVFRETQIQLTPFFSKPIPVSIFYQAGDQRVVLATTVPSTD